VQLTLREIFSRADMVLSSMPTVSNGRLLESAGEVYLRAAQDTSIRLSKGVSIRLQTPVPANVASRDSMQLFAGPTGTGAACFNWTLNTDPGSYLTPNPNGYTITVGSILYNSGVGWFNCDRFYSSPNPQNIIVNVTGSNIDPEKNTMVFAVFRTFNGSLRLCDFTAPGTFRSGAVPLGTPVSVAVIRTDGGKLYYGRQDGTVQANSPFSPTLKETTAAALVADLNLL
jgi:outer membrane protein assembly factor BamB